MVSKTWRAAWILLVVALAGCGGAGPGDPPAASAAAGRTEGLQKLLAEGAGESAKNGALIAAARAGRAEAISILLRSGADPNHHAGRNDWTPLMHAIHKNQKRSVEALLDGGADVNAKNNAGMTALMMAAGYGYADIVRELLARGADPYAEAGNGANSLAVAVGGVPDIDRFTVCSCQTETVQALLERAPDLKLKGNWVGRSALWFARLGRCSDVLRLLEGQKAAGA